MADHDHNIVDPDDAPYYIISEEVEKDVTMQESHTG
jgi:hypothetical protein